MPPKKRLIPPPSTAVALAEAAVATESGSQKPKKQKRLVPPQDCLIGVETMTEPIVVKQIRQIQLTRFTHDGKNYYRNCENDSLYEFLGTQKRGCYMGKWDVVRQCIVRDAPESDSEL